MFKNMPNLVRKALGLRTHHQATYTVVNYQGQNRMAVVIDPDLHQRVIVKRAV